MTEPYDAWEPDGGDFPLELKLEQAGQAFERGDKGALLFAISMCASYRVPLPPWAAEAFMIAYFDVKWGRECLSWDEVFGVPHPKHVRRLPKGGTFKQSNVCRRVRELRQQQPRRDVFPEVAAEFAISVALARKYFYDAEKAVSGRRGRP